MAKDMDDTKTWEAVEQAMQNGQKGQARRLLQQIVSQNPSHARAWLGLAELATSPGARREYLARAEALPSEAEGSPPQTMAAMGETAVVWRDFQWLLAGALVLLLLLAFERWIGFLQPLRLLLGLAYVLYVPGYCLAAAFFPARDDLDSVERTGLSLGLSVAWVPVLALGLDRLPWGLRLWPIAGGELLSILIFSALALWRRRQLPVHAVYAPQLDWQPRQWWQGLALLERRIYLLCAAALLIAAAAAAYILLVPSPDEFLTEFYILGPEGSAENFPRETAVGEELSLTVGIVNQERAELSYRIEAWAIDPWNDRREQVGAIGPISLAPTETAEHSLRWAMPWSGQDQVVEFYLFTSAQIGAEPYRQLRLWLDVTVE